MRIATRRNSSQRFPKQASNGGGGSFQKKLVRISASVRAHSSQFFMLESHCLRTDKGERIISRRNSLQRFPKQASNGRWGGLSRRSPPVLARAQACARSNQFSRLIRTAYLWCICGLFAVYLRSYLRSYLRCVRRRVLLIFMRLIKKIKNYKYF